MSDGVAVGFERELRRRASRLDRFGRPLLAILVGDDFEFAGLVFHIVPADTVGGLAGEHPHHPTETSG